MLDTFHCQSINHFICRTSFINDVEHKVLEKIYIGLHYHRFIIKHHRLTSKSEHVMEGNTAAKNLRIDE